MSPDLPDLLARLAEACGEGVALKFAGEFGGREIYLPAPDRLTEEHPIAVLLGLKVAKVAAAALGPSGRLIVPLGPTSTQKRTRARIRALTGEGKPVGEIARVVGVHERTVYYRRAKDREATAERGPDLFDALNPKPR